MHSTFLDAWPVSLTALIRSPLVIGLSPFRLTCLNSYAKKALKGQCLRGQHVVQYRQLVWSDFSFTVARMIVDSGSSIAIFIKTWTSFLFFFLMYFCIFTPASPLQLIASLNQTILADEKTDVWVLTRASNSIIHLLSFRSLFICFREGEDTQGVTDIHALQFCRLVQH